MLRVLVVDDDPGVRQVVRRGLERQGLEVSEAPDAEVALRHVAATLVDVVVVDLHLPGMSGLDLLGELRVRDPDLHLIMLTGAGAEADRVLGLESGADDYVVKPFSARELAARVVAAGRHPRVRAGVGASVGRDEGVDPDPAFDAAIHRGLEAGQFEVHYQPILRLDDGRWHGVEALVRWQHPDWGLLAPVAFVDAAERSGAILAIGQHVLEVSCEQWAAWYADGHDLRLSVNLSPLQLGDPRLVDRLVDAMATYGVPPERLWLEVTESALVDDLDHAAAVLGAIADLGVGLSIDDFGTGWASLTYVQRFPIGELKIDRTFVAGLERGAADEAIVGSILSLGRRMDLVVVAEGIETRGQRDVLLEMGCELGQGYLFGRPVPADRLDPGHRG